MTIEMVRNFLLWCAIINYAVLVLWFAVFVFGGDVLFELHSRWFQLSKQHFDQIHYVGMALYKISIILFSVVPYVALRIVG